MASKNAVFNEAHFKSACAQKEADTGKTALVTGPMLEPEGPMADVAVEHPREKGTHAGDSPQ